MAVIIILMGLAFPVFTSVQNAAKKTQAKNDLVQIVTAVNAFYTEYGRYPVNVSSSTTDAFFGTGTAPSGATSYGNNEVLLNVLRNNTSDSNVAALNPRQIVFISPPDVKNGATIGGIGTTTNPGRYFDPWGTPYSVLIDTNYDNQITNPYGASGGAGSSPTRQGVIAWSVGRNGALGGGAATGSSFSKESGTAGTYTNSSDVISWQ